MDMHVTADDNDRMSDMVSAKPTDAVDAFTESVKYSLAQQPLLSLAQLADRTIGTNLADKAKFMDKPQSADFGSPEWHAQQFGSAVGTFLPFLATHQTINAFRSPAMRVALDATRIKQAAAAGAMYSLLFDPASEEAMNGSWAQYWSEKGKHAGTSAAIFGGMTAGSIALNEFTPIRNDILSAGITAVPIGAISTQLSSILDGKGPASLKETAEGAYSFGLVGTAFGGAQRLFHGATADVRALRKTPLNVGGNSAEPIAAQMSNFTEAPFWLDGKRYASVEGFYVGLKWSTLDPTKAAEAADLSGAAAKKFGRKANADTATYNGETFELGSPEHHALVKRAIQAKLEQNPDIAARFIETYPRRIIHDLGYPESPKTKLPAKDFSRILTELREDLIRGRFKPQRHLQS